MNLTKKSKKFFEEAQLHLVGGVNSPVRAFKNVDGNPIFFSRGKGAYLFDVDGNRFIDLVSSWGPLILGHLNLSVVNKIKKTLRQGITFGAPSVLEIELAKEIKKSFKSIEKIRFVNSGTEATLSAIRLARAYTHKKRIIKFDGCYHGHSDSLLIAAGSGPATLGLPDSPGVPPEIASLTTSIGFNDFEAVKKTFETMNDIAAVIVEPIPGNMGVVIPHPAFLKSLREITSQYQALLIFDEVMTGFRVSMGGAQEIYEIQPDLTTLGKIIGGGFPVGAYGGKSEIMDLVAPVGNVYQAGTLSGNPIAMAAGLATLKELKNKNVHSYLNKHLTIFDNKVQESIKKTKINAVFQRSGSMATLFFNSNPVLNYEDAKHSNLTQFKKFFYKMLERGIYLPPSQFEAWFFSFALTEKQMSKIAKAIDEVLITMRDE
jgi:glutamate-1-semialdehyde 2,1-aminomutase